MNTSHPRKKWAWRAAFGGVLALAVLPATAALKTDPVAVIRHKDQELQKCIKDKNSDKKTGEIKQLINGIFDFEELGRRALGKKAWAGFTPDQQSRFVSAFKRMVENSSIKKLEVYQSDSTRYDSAEVDGEKASVTAHVFNKQQESIVTYKLLQKDSTWKAWDLIIDDLSTAGNYGDQFRKILQKNSPDDLIAKLEKKADSDEAKADNVKVNSEKKAAKSAKAETTSKKSSTPPASSASQP